jgi:small neutral amino acid transporter SnatA (MarC family)
LQRLAIPDWRFASGLTLLIIALRILRQRAEKLPSTASVRPRSKRFTPEAEPDVLPEELNPAA